LEIKANWVKISQKQEKQTNKKRKTRKSYCTWREEIKRDYSEMHYLFTEKTQRNIYLK